MDTACKNCIFAVYDNNKELPLQVGCKLDMIEKFKSVGVNIIEATDNKKDFYVIENRLCQYSRTEEWLTTNKIKLEDAYKILRDNVKVTCDLIIYFSHGSRLDDLSTTLSSVINQPLLPKNIIVALNVARVKPAHITVQFKKFPKLSSWKTELIIERQENGQLLSTPDVIDMIASKSKSMFYTTFESGKAIPPNFFQDLDILVNDKLQRFSIITHGKDNDINGNIVATQLHQLMRGDVLSKMKKLIASGSDEIPANFMRNFEDVKQILAGS